MQYDSTTSAVGESSSLPPQRARREKDGLTDCSPALDQALELDALGDVHQHDRRVETLEPVLKEKGHFLHNHARTALRGFGGACGHPLADQRMDDGVEAQARVLVVEDKLPQPGAIDASIAHELGSELSDHLLEARASRFVRGVGRIVGVQHLRAELSQHRCNR
jgi:hypothetical protein